ncbi:MAG: glycosyltransferase [Myxococcaceae bacterium]|nr:glycosyltransferase [Myxococcaceae bacterium]
MPAPHATSRRLSEYLKGLNERYQTVVLSVKTPDHSHIERFHGARLLRVPVGSGDLRTRMEAFDRAVRRQLESEEYLIVHFFDPVSGYPLCERRGDFGYKLVYDACRFPSGDLPSLLPQEGSNKRLLARSRRQELFCLMNADAVVVGSHAARAHCISLGVPGDHIEVLRAPVDLAPYSPEVMGKPDGQPMRLLHLGSHGRHQDLPVLFEALTKTKAAVKLALVGPSAPELTPPLKERVAELKLEERVEFQEPVAHDDIHKVLAAADVGVLTLTGDPRNSTTTALARIGEFLAAGRPIIAADLPLTRELVPPDAARFYRVSDSAALAEAIDALATDPALRRTLGEAARAATTPIDTQIIRQALISLYQRVAPQARAPEDAASIDPSEATQLGGRPPDETGDVTQAGVPLPIPVPGSDPGTNKVKTDPALVAPPPEADTGTDQAVARERPPVMGVLLRDEGPPVPPEPTDPAVVVAREPPIVMGLPVSDQLPDAEAVEAPPPREGPPVPDEEPGPSEPATRPPRSSTAPPRAPEAQRPETEPPAPSPSERPPGAPSVSPESTLSDALPTRPSPPEPSPPPAPAPPASLPASATGASSLPLDDEPLDLPSLLKPATAARAPVPAPEITAPNPMSAPRAPAPVPIPVPTSFSLPTRPATSPPGATFVPVPVGVSVTTTPARVPLAFDGALPVARPSAPAAQSGPGDAPPSNGASPVRPPPLAGPTSSPSGVKPLPSGEAAGASAASAVRPPPLAGPASSPSGVKPLPSGEAAGASAASAVRSPPLAGPASAPLPSGDSAGGASSASAVRSPPLAGPASAPLPSGDSAGPSSGSAVRPPPLAGPPSTPLPTGDSAGGASSASGVRPPPLAGPTSSPSGVKVLPTSEAAGGASPASAVRPPPLMGPASSPSGARALPSSPPPMGPPALREKPAPELAAALPPLVRLVPGATGAPVLTRAAEDIEEVQDDEVEMVNDESFASLHDEQDEHEEIDSHVHSLDTSATPPPSRLDPWFAQLVHGYCPPQSQLFTRHVPPTTMPGRDT